jgi:hypothetical protein
MIAAALAYLAAETGGSDLIVNPWAQLGATGGLIAVLIVAIRVLYKAQSDTIADLKAQRDEAQEDVKELNKELQTSVVPALVEFNRTGGEINRALLRVISLLDQTR